MINKIVNATERALLIDSLLEAGFTMDDILIRWFNATKVGIPFALVKQGLPALGSHSHVCSFEGLCISSPARIQVGAGRS